MGKTVVFNFAPTLYVYTYTYIYFKVLVNKQICETIYCRVSTSIVIVLPYLEGKFAWLPVLQQYCQDCRRWLKNCHNFELCGFRYSFSGSIRYKFGEFSWRSYFGFIVVSLKEYNRQNVNLYGQVVGQYC